MYSVSKSHVSRTPPGVQHAFRAPVRYTDQPRVPRLQPRPNSEPRSPLREVVSAHQTHFPVSQGFGLRWTLAHHLSS